MVAQTIIKYNLEWVDYEKLQGVSVINSGDMSANDLYSRRVQIYKFLSSNDCISLINSDLRKNLNPTALYFRISMWLSNYSRRSFIYRFIYRYRMIKYLKLQISIRKCENPYLEA